MTPSRVVVFIAAAMVAAFGTAYYAGALDTYLGPVPKKVASLDGKQTGEIDDTSSDTPSEKPESSVSGEKTQARKATPEEDGAGEQASQTAASKPQAPKAEATVPAADDTVEAAASDKNEQPAAEKSTSGTANADTKTGSPASNSEDQKSASGKTQPKAAAKTKPDEPAGPSTAENDGTTANAEKENRTATSGETPASDTGQTDVASLEGADTSKPQGAMESGVAADMPASEGNEPKGVTGGKDAAAGPAAANKVVVPTFDLVRVEPDGSMVVAGHAAPNSTVELVAGSKVLGNAKSGPQGDFAIVLDNPLAPGDYQIVLRSTTRDNVVAASRETAVVSVPENANGEVLALVEEPGKPSRLITVPTGEADKEQAAPNEGSTAVTQAGGANEKTATADQAASAPESKSSAAQGGDASPVPENRAAADSASVEPRQDDAVRQRTAEPKTAMNAPAVPQEPAMDKPVVEAPETKKSSTAADQADSAQPVKKAAPQGNDGPEVAAVTPKNETSRPKPAPESSEPKVFIQAVEIDGGKVFVAGGAKPGYRVRVYANDILLGETVTSPGGRFLVEATRDLPVGDYIVRADVLSPNGAEVIARAAVPFEREPGEKLAAVAPKPARAALEKKKAAHESDTPEPSAASQTPDKKTADSMDAMPTKEAEEDAPLADPVPEGTQASAKATGRTAKQKSEMKSALANAQEGGTAAGPKAAKSTTVETEAKDQAAAKPDSSGAKTTGTPKPEANGQKIADEDTASSATGNASAGKSARVTIPTAQGTAGNAAEKQGASTSASSNVAGTDAAKVDTASDEQGSSAQSTGKTSEKAPIAFEESKPEDTKSASASPAGPVGTAQTNQMSSEQKAGSVPAIAPSKQENDEIASTDDAGQPASSQRSAPLAGNASMTTEPKLQTVNGAVIIRRGDTLWHISQRVYGHGTRYSTLYLANRKQIRNPDRIWPGQVFSVPESTTKGEEADMKAIGDQAVPGDLAGTEPDWRK